MEKLPRITHTSSLPYCYYDIRREKIVLRVLSSCDADAIDILYGDPYTYTPIQKSEATVWVWQYQEHTLSRHYTSPEQILWKIELDVPKWRRFRYVFRVQTASGVYYYSENGISPYSAEALNIIANHFLFPYIHSVDAPDVPAWVQQTVWYQIFPERFYNGNPAISPANTADWEKDEPAYRNFFGGDLLGIRNQLHYLAELGITGIYLTPIFASPSNHKYDIQDYFAVDKHFGDVEELKKLVSEAHGLGIRVMLDAVFNHAGNQHPFWQDILQNQERSQYKDYFHIRQFPVKETYQDQQDMSFETFGFISRMPKWNTENPEARQYLLDAALYWIRECDIDGWRLDVANEVSFDFWMEFSKLVRKTKQDFYIVGEMWYDGSPWLNRLYFDAVMNYPLGFVLADYFLKKQIDSKQFAEKLVAALSRYSDVHTQAAFNLLDSHDTARALTLVNEDKQALRNAFTMLFLLPGSPCLYYGTELGMTGGQDPLCRRPMVWNKVKQDQALFAFFQKLIAFRRAHHALINNAALLYKPIESMHTIPCWNLSDPDGKETLSIVYTEHTAVKLPGTGFGQCVFSTGDVTGNELPPYTMAVYK